MDTVRAGRAATTSIDARSADLRKDLGLVDLTLTQAAPWLNVAHGTLREFHPLATALPVVSILSLNIAAKMGFGALGGFEYVAIHALVRGEDLAGDRADECRGVRAVRESATAASGTPGLNSRI